MNKYTYVHHPNENADSDVTQSHPPTLITHYIMAGRACTVVKEVIYHDNCIIYRVWEWLNGSKGCLCKFRYVDKHL